MAHNKPSLGRFGVTNYTVIEPSNVRDLDQQASESINGDEGGTWNPVEPIAIGGLGVKLVTDPAAATANFTGPIRTGPLSQGLILGDNEVPVFETARTTSFAIHLGNIFAKSESQPTVRFNSPFDAGVPGRIQTTSRTSGATVTYLNGWIPSYRLPRGSIISSVEFRFRVGYKPATLPAGLPMFRVFRVPKTGNYVSMAANELWDYPQWQPSFNYSSLIGTKYAVRRTNASGGLNSWIFRLVSGGGSFLSGAAQPAAFSAGTTIGLNIVDNAVTWQAEALNSNNGYFAMPRGNMVFSPTAPFGTSVDEFYAFGRTQTITITPNQNSAVDTANYNYGWDITDVTLCDVIYTSIKVNLTNVIDLRAY